MADYVDILRQYWGHPDFRGIQKEIIESIGSGRDTLGLMPTGGGKSITFQVPALAAEGVCLVITPLIALMKDQVQNLRRRGILAAAIYSGMTRQEIIKTLENCIHGHTKLLYISPERLASDLFQTKLRHIKVSFITVDEAHCISQWGYDFRPSYLHIADIRKLKPGAPVLALTATATPEVIDDILEKLEFRAPLSPDGGDSQPEPYTTRGRESVFRMSFERKNLTYVVRETLDKDNELVHILNSMPGSAIVYVRSRKRTKEIAEMLEANNISATFYHAGLEHTAKDIRQLRWTNDEARVIVATNAFGMGIDKPDVRLVIHYDSPDSIEAYFQEAGRAGRDGKLAYAVLLYDRLDTRKLLKRIDENYPPKEYICKIYEDLACFYQIGAGSGYGHTFQFSIEKFCRNFRHFPVQANAALMILARAQYIEYETNPDSRARVMFLLSRNDLYQLESLTPEEDALITALLREYGGLFTDYAYIDEAVVTEQAHLSRQQSYEILKSLSKRRILHFIPESNTPLITYTQPRELPESLIIPAEVYEKRKEQYARRIDAMIAYANNNDTCRSKQLLAYFGEHQKADCKRCDVCLSNSGDTVSEDKTAPARQHILNMLSDKQLHTIDEIRSIPLPREQVLAALQYLCDEELISIHNSQFIIHNP